MNDGRKGIRTPISHPATCISRCDNKVQASIRLMINSVLLK